MSVFHPCSVSITPVLATLPKSAMIKPVRVSGGHATTLAVLCVLCLQSASANPFPASEAAAAAAASHCNAECAAAEASDTQTANKLQATVNGPVLTCSILQSTFLDAIALFEPSGYPPDAEIVPALVFEPTGTCLIFLAMCNAQTYPSPQLC